MSAMSPNIDSVLVKEVLLFSRNYMRVHDMKLFLLENLQMVNLTNIFGAGKQGCKNTQLMKP